MKLKLAVSRRDLVLIVIAVIVAIAALWPRSRTATSPSAAASPQTDSRSTAATSNPSVGGQRVTETHLRVELLKKQAESEQAPEEDSRRNPFIFPRPKPKPADLAAAAAPPPKPRPTAEYQGYVTAPDKRLALIKMNNEIHVVAQGGRLPSGLTVVSVDPKQIVLKDTDGESYTFVLPR